MSFRLTPGYLDKTAEAAMAALAEKRPIAEIRAILQEAIKEGYMDGYNYGVQKVRGSSDRLAVDL